MRRNPFRELKAFLTTRRNPFRELKAFLTTRRNPFREAKSISDNAQKPIWGEVHPSYRLRKRIIGRGQVTPKIVFLLPLTGTRQDETGKQFANKHRLELL